MKTRYKKLEASKRLMSAAMFAALLVTSVAYADMFEDADRAAQESRLSDMQAIYERILKDDPKNARALSGKAAGAGELIAAALGRGELRAIAVATPDAVRKAFDDDSNLARRFVGIARAAPA